ncbi:tripartite tricarboxylate transporter TctB family protein [Halobacillus mangrovi]|uniref:tripartite tricarboxylate transporter TctB family protein n=1 Tax=Halobacillus mangrovi TaxID=402384 RepID=UPI0018DB565A|nr:tripartite tricarboxylate transporter TctB family protein [Halobacillus mangrovi]
MGEIIFHIVLIGVLVVFLNASYGISTEGAIDPVGPAAFPQFLLYLAILLALISLFRAIKKWRGERKTSDTASIINLPVVGMLVSLLVFLLLIDYLGFIFASMILLFSLFYLLGQKNWFKITIQSIILPLAFAFLFGNVLSVPLPRGFGMIEILSYYVY